MSWAVAAGGLAALALLLPYGVSTAFAGGPTTTYAMRFATPIRCAHPLELTVAVILTLVAVSLIGWYVEDRARRAASRRIDPEWDEPL